MMILDYLLAYNRYACLIGIIAILGLTWLFSMGRRTINWWQVLKAFLLQAGLGLLLLRVPFIEGSILMPVSNAFNQLFRYACVGSKFLFGNLIEPCDAWGSVFAFRVLPVIIFFAALSAILYYFGIIQFVVYWLNRAIRPILGTSGPETLSTTANIFLGQTEAPLLIKNYLAHMSRSEMFVIMVSGMAHISAAIMAVYATMGVPMKHMLIAAVMAVPGSILIAKMMLPEEKGRSGQDTVTFEEQKGSFFGALFQGTSSGVSLAVNVGAMLLVFLALLPLINDLIGWLGVLLNYPLAYAGVVLPALSLNYLFGLIFAPFAYLLGMTGGEAMMAGQILGSKVTLNEFIALQQMVQSHFSERALILLTYATCAFANFSSIGIQVGGIGALVPERREWLTQLGMRAVLASSLVNLLSACIIGLML